MADYLVGFLKGGKQFHDLDIALVGCLNGKEVRPDWIKLLRRTLDRNGLAHVKIVGGDMNGPPAAQWRITEVLDSTYQRGLWPAARTCMKTAGLKLSAWRE